MKQLIVVLLGAWVSVAAYAESQDVLSVADIVALTKYEQVGVDKERVLRGMSIAKRVPIGWVDDYSQRYIRTITDDQGVARHQVLLEMRYMGGWRFYRAASLGGQALPFNTEERRFSRCSSTYLECVQQEIVTAELSRQQLDDAMASGLAVRFEAKKPGRDTVAVFPAAYVMAYLIKLDGGQLPPSERLNDKVAKPESLVMAAQ
ncbi:hypothetical protein AB4876_06595 [Zhongshania guokunii]|uniref:Uncharacterized protein n=1 Tax=Zhongshania guokunii TaxID=641783 RepID=A0ABV3U3S3_9GAMM